MNYLKNVLNSLLLTYHRGKPVTKIESFGFYRMLNLKTVVIPNTINKIGDIAFSNCPNLQAIHVDNGNAYYKFEAGCLIEIETNKIIAGTNNSTIPSYITDIGEYAFCSLKITNIFIPASVKEVGQGAFSLCHELKNVVFENGSQLEKISIGMFSDCISLKNVLLPISIKSIEAYAFEVCTGLNTLIIPPNCIYIGEFAFCGWTSSQTIYITSFSSKAEADKAFALNWDLGDYEDCGGAKFVFLG